MTSKVFAITITLALLPFTMALPQNEPNHVHIGGGAGLTFPARNFHIENNTGTLFQLVDEIKVEESFSIAGHFGAYRFPYDQLTGTDENGNPVSQDLGDENIWLLTQGARFHADNFFIGLELGGFTGERKPDGISLFPTVGFQVGGFQIDARYKVLGAYDWATVSASYYLFEF